MSTTEQPFSGKPRACGLPLFTHIRTVTLVYLHILPVRTNASGQVRFVRVSIGKMTGR